MNYALHRTKKVLCRTQFVNVINMICMNVAYVTHVLALYVECVTVTKRFSFSTYDAFSDQKSEYGFGRVFRGMQHSFDRSQRTHLTFYTSTTHI